jgi:type I restriction enzyme R subunit
MREIGLTATPALHTTQIFGPPVFSYGYRQAVVDGWLIDHLPPRRITTAPAQTGIVFEAGEDVQIIDPRSGQVDLFTTPDQVDFEIQEFNKRVYTREFNRVVAQTLAIEIPPDAPGKTLSSRRATTTLTFWSMNCAPHSPPSTVRSRTT